MFAKLYEEFPKLHNISEIIERLTTQKPPELSYFLEVLFLCDL